MKKKLVFILVLALFFSIVMGGKQIKKAYAHYAMLEEEKDYIVVTNNKSTFNTINKKYDDLEQSIKQTDERYKVWLECTTTLDKLYAEDKIFSFAHANIELSEDTKKKLRTMVYDKREEELRKFYSKKAEVNAQLSMCETYDQKQEILRRYNIINKNGKVNG